MIYILVFGAGFACGFYMCCYGLAHKIKKGDLVFINKRRDRFL